MLLLLGPAHSSHVILVSSIMEISKDPSSVPNRGRTLVAVNITFAVAAVLANILRCYVRLGMVKAFGNDDWLMAFATVSSLFSSNPLTDRSSCHSSLMLLFLPLASGMALAATTKTSPTTTLLLRDVAGIFATCSTLSL